MAPPSRSDTGTLTELLYHEGRRFEFFQAVRLLRKLAPERSGVARDADPNREIVRFRSAVSLSFPTVDVTAIEPPAGPGKPPRLTVAFLGVATPASFGSLPVVYAQAILEQERAQSTVLREFLDVFNHRIASLYYRSFEKYHFAVAYESGDDSYFERALLGVLGLATPGLAGRLAIAESALFSRAGLLAMAPVPAVALEGLVRSYFGAQAAVEQFRPAWYTLEPEDLSRLGSANSRVGEDLVLGGRVRLTQYRFALRVGPLSWDDYEALLPTESGHDALFDLVRLSTAPEQGFEVRLVLRAADVPGIELSRMPERRCRLGWSTWLQTGARASDASDAVFRSESRAGVSRRPGSSSHPSQPHRVRTARTLEAAA